MPERKETFVYKDKAGNLKVGGNRNDAKQYARKDFLVITLGSGKSIDIDYSNYDTEAVAMFVKRLVPDVL